MKEGAERKSEKKTYMNLCHSPKRNGSIWNEWFNESWNRKFNSLQANILSVTTFIVDVKKIPTTSVMWREKTSISAKTVCSIQTGDWFKLVRTKAIALVTKYNDFGVVKKLSTEFTSTDRILCRYVHVRVEILGTKKQQVPTNYFVNDERNRLPFVSFFHSRFCFCVGLFEYLLALQ